MEANERQVEQDIRGVKPVSIVSCSYKLVQCESRRLSCPESPDNLHRAAKLSKPRQLGHDYQCHAAGLPTCTIPMRVMVKVWAAEAA